MIPGMIILLGCEQASNEKLFAKLPPEATNIDFTNELVGSTELNILEYLYYYDGGGIAAGDVNNDGLIDLFFTANELPNRLYINQGNLKFADATESAGIEHIENGWTMGVTMADVNADGYLDIYVSNVGGFRGIEGKNQLFINKGNQQQVQFEEMSELYGLDFIGFGTQASFFDFDNDGDLDVYLLNHAIHLDKSYQESSIRNDSDSLAGDKLLRNDSDSLNIRFTDVTKEAGIYNSYIGYGLAISTGDLNRDGFTDIFISNDFHENDYLYINQGDGTFTEQLETSMPHTSRSSMGNDIADVNNDGLPDVFVLDMLPADEQILRRSASEDSRTVYEIKKAMGYHDQLVRNTFQLNRGNLKFSDIALLTGTYATDWSWSPLLADFDNDGLKDIFISNGIPKRPNDLDFVRLNSRIQNEMRGSFSQTEVTKELLNSMPQDKTSNFLFKNMGELEFRQVQKQWGIEEPTWSNGAVYADLDNDGDLDLITNQIDDPAGIYENLSGRADHHYLDFSFVGSGKNTKGVGAQVELWIAGDYQYAEQLPTRGFHSAMPNRVHFGLGAAQQADSVRVSWPAGQVETIYQIAANQHLVLKQQNARTPQLKAPAWKTTKLQVDTLITPKFVHLENTVLSKDFELLRPHNQYNEGPPIAVGDVNNDGLEDVYIGGARGQEGGLFIQTPGQSFRQAKSEAFVQDRNAEDADALFFDADNDNDLDLYVVSGGGEVPSTINLLRDRLYLNNGKGGFSKAASALPDFLANGSVVAAHDFDDDGDMDLFIGSRSVPGQYGLNPKHFLLENNGSGSFTEHLQSDESTFRDLGMVTDALWANIDSEKSSELIVSSEFQPIRVLKNKNGQLSPHQASASLQEYSGLWNTLELIDIDLDGDMDIVAGNLGLNSKIKPSLQAPVKMFINDFDRNGSLDHLLCYKSGDNYLPFATRDEINEQLPSLTSKFLSYRSFSQITSVTDIIDPQSIAQSLELEITTGASMVFLNEQGRKFRAQKLPIEFQFSPIFAISPVDVNYDGYPDLLTGGNYTGAKLNYGLYDADYGLLGINDADNHIRPLTSEESGLEISGEIRDIERVKLDDGSELILFSRSGDSLLGYLLKKD